MSASISSVRVQNRIQSLDVLRGFALLGIALVIFAFQLFFSYFWLRNKKQGPLEWLWRKLAYRN